MRTLTRINTDDEHIRTLTLVERRKVMPVSGAIIVSCPLGKTIDKKAMELANNLPCRIAPNAYDTIDAFMVKEITGNSSMSYRGKMMRTFFFYHVEGL